VTEFLGEIVGTPFPDEDSIPLRAARREARLMGDQMRRAWLDFLEARCAQEPVLFVLDDLHWGDVSTVQFIDDALGRVKHKPWMVLALARPDVHARFPRLWTGRKAQEIALGELSRKASARLVRQVLGEEVGAETVERLVAHADGNAFYLEELIRATADGRPGALPETVLAMIQGRLEALDGAARRALRAASVFGETFWPGGVEALLGGGASSAALAEQLAHLERLEWIYTRPDSRFQGERELCFRHALVREAAYGMLTDDDRTLGHRLAGAWLAQVAESSAAVIGEHFERGGDAERAVESYRRAAAQALAANDLGAVLSLTDRALSLGAAGAGAGRGELAWLRAEALHWRGDLLEAERWAHEAVDILPKGSSLWFVAAGELGLLLLRLGQPDRLAVLADALTSAWSAEAATGSAVGALAKVVRSLFLAGFYERADALHTRIERVAPRFSNDPAVAGHLFWIRALRDHFMGNRGGAGMAGIHEFERAGDLRNACLARADFAYGESLLGEYAGAVALLRVACADAERMGLESVAGSTRHNLGMALGDLGALDEARAEEEQAIAAAVAQGDRRMEGASRDCLALILRRAGELAAAEEEARRAVDLLEGTKPLQIPARGTLAEVLLARGRTAEALAQAREAMALLESIGSSERGEVRLRLVHAEALEASGDPSAARAALTEAHARLLAAAGRIHDTGRRAAFLANVPENARTIAIARAWLGE
jgi:tetratricopeptide (TPR) repeat protein